MKSRKEPSLPIPGASKPDNPIQSRLKSVAFYSFHADDALSVLRMYGPAYATGLEVIRGVKNGIVRIDSINDADLVIIQRDFCKDYPSYLKIISQAHSQNKPVIIDLDDNLFVLPEDHPDRLIGYYTDSLLPTFQAVKDADLITSATGPLRDYLLPFNKNIAVLPNYLDDYLWKLTSQFSSESDGDKIVIGYMGGQTHQPDLQMLVPVFIRLLEKYRDRIQFHFWGIKAPAEVAHRSKVDWYPPVFFRYDEFVYAFQKQKADILVAPLCDNLFNSCKSAIKYLEYGAIGVPGIFSRVAPYIDTVEHGKDGFLASTDEDWMDGLIRLIESPELRSELAFNAQDKIRKHWLLSKNVGKRLKIYQDAIENFHPRERIPSSFNVIEKSITQQYYEGYSIKNNQLKALKDQLVDRDENIRSLNHKIDVDHEHINDLQNEVISYATSFSWKITRPFRAFMRLARRFFHA